MKAAVLIVTVFVFLALFSCSLCLFFANAIGNNNATRDKCYEWEAQGILKPGSCKCTQQIYADWDKSYDWQDSCAILNAQNHEK